MKKHIFTILVIIVAINFSFTASSFDGNYQGQLKMNTFNMEVVKSIARNMGISPDLLMNIIKENLNGDHTVTITSKGDNSLVVLDNSREFLVEIKENQIGFIVEINLGVSLEFIGQQDLTGNFEGEVKIQTPEGLLGEGSFKMIKMETSADTVEKENDITDDTLIETEEKPEVILDEVSIADIPTFEESNETFMTVSTLEEYYRSSKDDEVSNTEAYLEDIYMNNQGIEIIEDLKKRMKIYKNNLTDDITYEKEKIVLKGTNKLLNKSIGETPFKIFIETADNSLRIESLNNKNQIEDNLEKLGMSYLELRGYYDMSLYETMEERFLIFKPFDLKEMDAPGYMLQKHLNKLSDTRKKAFGKGIGREYGNFAKKYIEVRKEESNKEALKAAIQMIDHKNYYKDTFEFFTNTIMKKYSKVKAIESRTELYIEYLKEDGIYSDKEGE